MKIYKFEIPLKLPSANDYIRACRSNKYLGSSMKRDIENQISIFIKRLPKIEKPVTLHFTWIEKNYRRDLDNIAFAKKFILDALVKNGILENDNYKHVKGFRDDFEYGDEIKVRVEIEEQ